MTSTKTIVLVHGAWHGAWCWTALQAALDRRGVPSIAVDLPGHGASTAPLTDVYGDAEAVASTIARLGGDVVLTGHSYGGAVVTEAADRAPNVSHVVYVAALALMKDESVSSLIQSLPPEEVAIGGASRRVDLDALETSMAVDRSSVSVVTTVDPERAIDALYGDVDPAVAQAACARLSPQVLDSFGRPMTGTPIGRIPTTYVRCTKDRAVAPSHQDFMADRCDRRIELDTDHSPFFSKTDELADILADVARG